MAITFAKTITQLMGEGISIAIGTAALSNSVTLSVTTGLKNILFATAQIDDYPSTTTGDPLECQVPTQTGTDNGKIHITAIGATGTTDVRWFVIGEAGR